MKKLFTRELTFGYWPNQFGRKVVNKLRNATKSGAEQKLRVHVRIVYVCRRTWRWVPRIRPSRHWRSPGFQLSSTYHGRAAATIWGRPFHPFWVSHTLQDIPFLRILHNHSPIHITTAQNLARRPGLHIAQMHHPSKQQQLPCYVYRNANAICPLYLPT